MVYKKFISYGAQDLTEEDKREVLLALEKEWITSGPTINEFEESLCLSTNAKYSVAVSSGTAALDLAVASLELKEGSEIITTPFTFVATANSILYNNCVPVFADIKNDTYCLDPEQVSKKITEKTRAIITVDYAGHPSEFDELKSIAKRNNLWLIDDAAHALGAEYKNEKVGSIADLTTFSFHPVKHITTGEGGAVATNKKELYEKLLCLRNHGIDRGVRERKGYMYDMKYLGRNYRITDFQCALGKNQLKRLNSIIEKRNHIAQKYSAQLSEIAGIKIPSVKEGMKHAWHIYSLLLPENISRDDFFYKMREKNIGVNVHYIPIYKFSYYKKNYDFEKYFFPITENVFNREITLPLHTKLSEEELDFIISSVKEECIEV